MSAFAFASARLFVRWSLILYRYSRSFIMLSKLRKNAPHEGLGTSSFDDLFWSCASDLSVWRFCLRDVGTRTLLLGTLLFRFEIASIGPKHVSAITWLSSSLPCLLGILFLRFRKRLRCGSCCSPILYKVRFGSLFGKNYPLGRLMSREATFPKRQIELLSFSTTRRCGIFRESLSTGQHDFVANGHAT
jgi:hypothetical protein